MEFCDHGRGVCRCTLATGTRHRMLCACGCDSIVELTWERLFLADPDGLARWYAAGHGPAGDRFGFTDYPETAI